MERADALHKETGALTFLYETAAGRVLLKLLTLPWVSALCGAVMESPLSRCFIGGYIRRHGIDMRRFEERRYRSFNDFFTRKLSVPAFLDVPPANALHAPCDGSASVYFISQEQGFRIKNSVYTAADLLGSEAFANEYDGGICFVFRLAPADYHRYCYIDDGEILSQRTIKGILHTVRPIAHSRYPVFTQNTRVCTAMQLRRLGLVTQVEVGAMLVGKIKNHKPRGSFAFGEEKGYFEFGGSSIILLIKSGVLRVSETLERAMALGQEQPVRTGEIIGRIEPKS